MFRSCARVRAACSERTLSRVSCFFRFSRCEIQGVKRLQQATNGGDTRLPSVKNTRSRALCGVRCVCPVSARARRGFLPTSAHDHLGPSPSRRWAAPGRGIETERAPWRAESARGASRRGRGPAGRVSRVSLGLALALGPSRNVYTLY